MMLLHIKKECVTFVLGMKQQQQLWLKLLQLLVDGNTVSDENSYSWQPDFVSQSGKFNTLSVQQRVYYSAMNTIEGDVTFDNENGEEDVLVELQTLQLRQSLERRDVGDLVVAEEQPLQILQPRQRPEVGDLVLVEINLLQFLHPSQWLHVGNLIHSQVNHLQFAAKIHFTKTCLNGNHKAL